MVDIKGLEIESQESISSIFKSGIKFVFYSKQMIFYVTGSIFFSVTWLIWSELVLIPMYFGYTGSDYLAGIFRTIAYFLGLFLIQKGSKLSTRISYKRGIPMFKLTHGLMVFAPFILIFTIFPLENHFNIIPVITYLFIAFLFPFLDIPGEFLEKTFYLEKIPNKLRNSYYSLLSTLIAFSSIPGLIAGGLVIQFFGYNWLVVLIIGLLILSTLFIWIGLNRFNPNTTGEDLSISC